MDPERWKQVDSLLQAALERPPEEREAFLENACAGDEPLAREIRSLLASRQKAESFLESPAMEVAARAEALRGAGRQTDPLIGQTVSHYRIIGKLGMGGMGVVYKATDEKLHRIVALKCLRAEESTGSERNRFLQEARAASALDHPNIGVVHGIEELDDGRLFIVMAYYDGETLAERLKRAPLDPATGVGIVRQAAHALAEAHAKNIVHRDVKPANIMLTRQGSVKLLDFGLAKQLSGDETLTQTGTTMGTAAYMSPEQARGQHVDHHTDIWSLGVVLYEILSGRQPFQRDSVPSTLLAVTQDSPLPLVGAPAGLEAAVFKCLSKDVDRRYQRATDLARDLEPDRVDRVASGGTESTITLPSGMRADSAQPATAWENVAKRWKTLVPTAVVVLALLAGGYFYFGQLLFGKPKLTDKDTIVLAEFVNKTDDPLFDGTLRQGLAVQLEQSPFLSLISDERIQEVLGLMRLPADARLTLDVAKQICERTGSAAVLDGSITRLGSQYVLGLRARNCRSGDLLDAEQGQAPNKEAVLNVWSQIAGTFRTKIGESLVTIEKHQTGLEDATTSSLEAFKAYSTGMHLILFGGHSAAIPLFQKAIDIDQGFAMAHAMLGRAYGDLWEPVLSAESLTKAFNLRNRASERERYFIEGNYHTQVTGDLEQAHTTGVLWAQTYPRDPHPVGMLSYVDQELGQYQESVEAATQTIQRAPELFFGYNNLAWAYVQLNHPEKAEETLRTATARKTYYAEYSIVRYSAAFLRGDQQAMAREASGAVGKPAEEDWMSALEAATLGYSGRLPEARIKLQHAVDLDQQPAQHERAALYQAGGAVREALFGNKKEALQGAAAARKLSDGRDVKYGAALALAFSGETAASQAIATELAKHFREDTLVRFVYVPVLGALAALPDDPARSIGLLRAAAPFDLSTQGGYAGCFGNLYSAYVRGLAYEALHQGPEAVAEFQKILGNPGLVSNDPIGPLAGLEIGRVFAMSRDKVKAKTAYEKFLTLWKEGDSDTPVLKQAKAEYANLQ